MNNELFSLLACPRCHGEFIVQGKNEGLACPTCQVVYPIVESIPILLVEEAIATADWQIGKRPAQQQFFE